MNQILQVSDKKLIDKSAIAKRIILVVFLIIILLGVGVGGYFVYQNIIDGNIKLPAIIGGKENKATITFTQTENNQLIINAQSEKGISKIIYSVNGEEAQTIELVGEVIVEETIDIYIGENTVFVTVIDINGEETKKEDMFIVEAPKPIIDLAVVGNDIKITVTSEIELAEITYKWNSENEKIENMKTYEDRMLFEKKLEIPIGQNKLTIIATDINGSRTEKTQEIKGVTKAKTTTKVEGEYLHFTVTGKENIQKVEFQFNGRRYLMNTETFGETKVVHYKIKLIKGINYLTVTSTTQSGGIDTATFEQKYTKK